jgi:hypothetical protein
MGSLTKIVSVNPKFRSAVRLDRDFASADFDGYIVHETAARILGKVFETLDSQGSMSATLTGPYGSGKSSLAVFLSRLLAGDENSRFTARKKLPKRLRSKVEMLVGDSRRGWLPVHVVGRRAPATTLIREALREAIHVRWPNRKALVEALDDSRTDGSDITSTLGKIGSILARENSGLVLIIDEMGKVLEHAALNGGDLHIFQDLAEVLADIGCPVFLGGILHQSFEGYARSLGAHGRDEWAKIQGRYEDIPFSLSLDESVQLLANAIVCKKGMANERIGIAKLLKAFDSSRLSNNKGIEDALVNCWPLHPLTALMLGPMSRRAFGQNERSIFSFLASRDPGGFIDFLELTGSDDVKLYSTSRLWDYLQHNFEHAMLSSPRYGKQYSEAAEGVARASKKGKPLHVDLAKTIALMELYGSPFGLIASNDALAATLPDEKPAAIKTALRDLSAWSVIVFRSYTNGWGVFAGSDIDLNEALNFAKDQIGNDDVVIFGKLPSLTPVIAKKHYHETGTLRWFDRLVLSPSNVLASLEERLSSSVCAGVFCICAAQEQLSIEEEGILRQGLLNIANRFSIPVLFTFDYGARGILVTAKEIAALKRLKTTLPALAGDAVARRELAAREHAATEALVLVLDQGFETAEWDHMDESHLCGSAQGLSRLCSNICDAYYTSSPRIFNELINRDRISANVAAARRKLMYSMVSCHGEANLGIVGYPPEMSLYLNLLKQSRMHKEIGNSSPPTYKFVTPPDGEPSNFAPLYEAFDSLLSGQKGKSVTAAEIFTRLRQPPFGIRLAVLPILFLHYALARNNRVAVYQTEFFSPNWTEELVDQLLQRPETIALRWVDGKSINKDLLRKVASFVQVRFEEEMGESALDVTKPLVQFVLRLPPFVRRTNSLSAPTRALRDNLANATDPLQLLFRDLHQALGLRSRRAKQSKEEWADELVSRLSEAITELMNAEAKTLSLLKKSIFSALQAGGGSSSDFDELRDRASVLPTDTGDERLNGLIARARSATNSDDWIKAVASLAAGKPYRSWTDGDVATAQFQLTDLGRRFRHVESFVAASRKRGKTVSYALTLHDNKTGIPQTVASSLTLNKKSLASVEDSLKRLRNYFNTSDLDLELKKMAIVSLLLELEQAVEQVEEAG